jgi:acyl-CoA reductase-like NAD-dependent aldehyde dehydrogenase
MSKAGAGAAAAAGAAELHYTPASEIPAIVAGARAAFDSGRTKALSWRTAQLRAIRRMLDENTDAIVQAIHGDLRRPKLEAVLAEVRGGWRESRRYVADGGLRHASGVPRTSASRVGGRHRDVMWQRQVQLPRGVP